MPVRGLVERFRALSRHCAPQIIRSPKKIFFTFLIWGYTICIHIGNVNRLGEQNVMRKHLFLIGGASGCGKTAICQTLAGQIDTIICLDGDSLWHPQVFNLENTMQFYDLWFKLAKEITDNDVSVAIFHAGLGLPKTFHRLQGKLLLSIS